MARREIEEWADAFIRELEGVSGPFSIARQVGWTPRVDVLEAEDFILVKAELAGVPADSVQLHYRSATHVLQVRGRRQEPMLDRGEAASAHQLEIEYGAFSRDIELPEGVMIDAGRARTAFRMGMLYAVLPKADARGGTIVIEGTIRMERIL